MEVLVTTRRDLLAAAAGALTLPLLAESEAQGEARLYTRKNRIVRVWEEQVPMPVREFYAVGPPEYVGKITPRKELKVGEFYSARWDVAFLELPLPRTFRLLHVEVEVEGASEAIQVMAEHPERLQGLDATTGEVLSSKLRYWTAPLFVLPPEDGDERLALQAVAAQVSRTARTVYEDVYGEDYPADMVRRNVSDGTDLLHVRVQGSDGVRHAVMTVWPTFTEQDLRWRLLQTTEQLFG